MKMSTATTGFIVLLLLLVSVGITSGKTQQNIQADVQLSQQTPDKDARSYNHKILTPMGQEQYFISIGNPLKQPCQAHTICTNQNVQQSEQLPRITNTEKTFTMHLRYKHLSDLYILSLADFTWDEEQHCYSYDQGTDTYEFKSGNFPFAQLKNLQIIYDFDVPYKISYSYELKSYPLNFAPFGDMITCLVSSSPLQVESGLYRATETFNAETVYESYDDSDGTVIKQAVDCFGGGYKSMGYFKVNSGHYKQEDQVYKRGLLRLVAIAGDGKTPTGGARISAYAQTMHFDIIGEMDQFWIDSGWEGTIGDKYSTSQRFRIEPRD